MKTIRLRADKSRSLLRRHPWIFESAMAKGGGDSGETVRVEAADGAFLAWAAYSPQSRIRARVWSFDAEQRIDRVFFEGRLRRAVNLRARLAIPSDGLRLVHGEADGLPGLVVDRYGDLLVAPFGSAGVERWKAVIADLLLEVTGLCLLYERSDASVRGLEGLPEVSGWLRGPAAGAGAPLSTERVLTEHRWRLTVDVATGHKTGFYLDQRDNRRHLFDAVQRLGLQRVLNCFGYTGGFTVAALMGGARQVLTVDSSGPALQRAAAHVALNGLPEAACEWRDADVNQTLRQLAEQGARFDAIVLDPPKFAPTVTHAERAARAYKDINRLALGLLEPGGLLYTFSCSGGIGVELFHKIVAGAAADAGVEAVITDRLSGAPDHALHLAFPEGEYLKGLVLMRC